MFFVSCSINSWKVFYPNVKNWCCYWYNLGNVCSDSFSECPYLDSWNCSIYRCVCFIFSYSDPVLNRRCSSLLLFSLRDVLKNLKCCKVWKNVAADDEYRTLNRISFKFPPKGSNSVTLCLKVNKVVVCCGINNCYGNWVWVTRNPDETYKILSNSWCPSNIIAVRTNSNLYTFFFFYLFIQFNTVYRS